MNFLYSDNAIYKGLAFLRITIGFMFVMFGFGKLMGGIAGLSGWLGKLNFPFPMLLAYLAAMTELIGGIMLILGFLTRFSAVSLAFTMFMAIIVHIMDGHEFRKFSPALTQLLIMISIIIMGSSRYSLDYKLFSKNKF